MTFLHPLLLLALLVLPFAYWVTRMAPPPAKQYIFPPLKILQSIQVRRSTPARASIWLFILRSVALALIILGLAHPIWSPKAAQDGWRNDDITLIIDNGWAAYPNQTLIRETILRLGKNSFAHGHAVTLVATARQDDGSFTGPVVSHDLSLLRAHLQRVRPRPWPTERAQALKDVALGGRTVLLLSDGVATDDDASFRAQLQSASRWFTLTLPDRDIFSLKTVGEGNHSPRFLISRLGTAPTELDVVAETASHFTLRRDHIVLTAGQKSLEWQSNLPAPVQRKMARVSLRLSDGHQAGPASIFLMNDSRQRHPVGLLLAPGQGDDINTPSFYLRHALSQISDMRQGRLDQLLAQKLSVIIWPSQTALRTDDQHRLKDFVMQGGWLVRFVSTVDAAMGENQDGSPENSLLPVRLVGNLRDLDSVMSWEKPQTLAAFPPASPFNGLVPPGDLVIRRTVIAQPDPELPGRIWARLTDGTPLVTARNLGRGEIVLFHADSGPEWSNLPLTGLFPDMLDRIVRRSTGVTAESTADKWPPLQLLGDEGDLRKAVDGVQPLTASTLTVTRPGPAHPPGMYGMQGAAHAYNLGPFVTPLQRETMTGRVISAGQLTPTHDAGAALVLIGVLCLLADIILRARHLGLMIFGVLVFLGFSARPAVTAAQATSVAEAARATRLAYILTGQETLDAVSRQGMKGISDYASDRTSARLAAPDGVRPGEDDLAPYPLLYWPIDAQTKFEAKRNAALEDFIAHGGMLLIDIIDAGEEDDDALAAQRHLAEVTRGIHLPALAKLDARHILAHCFYILRSFPGRYAGKAVWVARNADPNNDSVSPVIIGQADWARAWAVDDQGNHPYAVIPGRDRQRTLAERFGVNIIIYALTGNYKQDQMKVPALLKRLQP
ncbi:hypothetical protein CGLAMM_09350 [Acetobacteraceae bacterium EV16G]|uniref:DUF4159 domain-containing protein n=1 Tax=Sorlinia euscelidii TaxID=3081148 RepID=A0ABU7TZS1_9PROT